MIWKDIKGYEGVYQVSDTGLVKSLERYSPCILRGKETVRHIEERILKPWKRSSYLLVDLWNDGKRDVRSIHVLVYETFVEPLLDKEVVHHIDEDKFNNCLSNLKKMTYTEHNTHHPRKIWNKGIHPDKKIFKKMWETRGALLKERNNLIRNDYGSGMTVKELSEKYSICTRSIYDIVNRRTKC